MSDPSRIRLAILRHAYFPGDVRVDREVHALADSGCDVTVLCLRRPGEKSFEDAGHIHVHRIPLGRRRRSKATYVIEYAISMILMAWRISRLAIHRRFDVIQVNTLPDCLVFVTLIPRLLGSRIMIDLHEPTLELYETKYGNGTSRIIRHILVFIEKYAIRFSHHALTVNDTIRQRFIDRGAPADKITVVRNVPPEDILRPPKKHRQNSTLDFLLMTHGTLQARYGQDILIRALGQIRESIPNIKVQIVGGGETEPELRRLAEYLRYEDIVEFTATVPRKELPEYLIQADVGVVPLSRSPFSDLCQPNKLFDYVALKVPVIAARVPAIEETFDDQCICYYEPGNQEDLSRAVIELHQNAEKRQSMAERSYKNYQVLRWNIAKQVYLREIERLVGRSLNGGEF
jgi:glycosyltransferase involved in cell wall biosynthesis